MSSVNRFLVIWLIVLTIMLFMMVILGGLTRLTGSGLSMVHWQPLTIMPPMSEEAWDEEFSHYKGSPEYKEVNRGMNLDGFKKIYWVEYLHRSFGRLIGVVWFFPMIAFWVINKKRKLGLNRTLKWALILGILGGFQGALGWYMVKSGLVENHPWVSHYRLAMHLSLAMVIITLSHWLCLSVWFPKKETSEKVKGTGFAHATLIAIWLQIALGGLVAGLHGGLFFRAILSSLSVTWVPGIGLLNLVENPATILFIHICGALIVSLMILKLFIDSLRQKELRILGSSMFILLIIQLKLGVLTALKYSVVDRPIALGSIHQATGVLLLIACMSYLYFKKNRPRQVSHS